MCPCRCCVALRLSADGLAQPSPPRPTPRPLPPLPICQPEPHEFDPVAAGIANFIADLVGPKLRPALTSCFLCHAVFEEEVARDTVCAECKTRVAEWWDMDKEQFRTDRKFTTNNSISAAEANIITKAITKTFPTTTTTTSKKKNLTKPNPETFITRETLTTKLEPEVMSRTSIRESEPTSFSLLPESMGDIMASVSVETKEKMKERPNNGTIEERLFNAALLCLEFHFERPQSAMPISMERVKKIMADTLDKSLKRAEVRETLAKNVDVWMHFRKIFNAAIPVLEKRSIRQPKNADGTVNGHDNQESADLILLNYDSLLKDLHYLNSLLVISRNMLAIKDTAQEICAAVHFDESVQNLVVLCVDVTSKGYDGETVDEAKRARLNDITELYKKLLVTCLQHTHNWTMGNDRFKMSFWFEMLFDEQMKTDTIHELPPDDLNVENVYQEVSNWLRRHNKKDKKAKELLDIYTATENSEFGPGPLPRMDEDLDEEWPESTASPVWKPDMEDKFEQDRLYGRVSHEVDIWWKKVRDANFDGWVVKMATVEDAMDKANRCRQNAMHRYMPQATNADQYQPQEQYDHSPDHQEVADQQEIDNRSTQEDNGEEDEEDEEDDESYVEGPLRGLLTEIPNILDTKQIEALHMTVKACIVDSMGSGLTPAGENLQKTRCKMFLALDCGKNLLRELLVFIAVWEQTDTQFIFQITAQIIESFHHNALLPYAWNSLRILKDIVSPAQTVLLRLINYMFRARKDSPIYDDVKDYNRDAKLIHFLYNYFRERVVPDCLALIHAQAMIRQQKRHQQDFPVDLWDMERAKDGLSQYLDFISVIAEIPEMRHLLIEWEAVYELVALLKALEAGVARKPLVDNMPLVPGQNGDHHPPNPHSQSNLPPLHDTPHKFPWSGIKIQILIILTALISPSNARRSGPGNPIVQKQLIAHEGIMPLLNCCVFDGHNEYLKERATLTIKFLMEGCKEAQDFVKELVPMKQAQAQAQAARAQQQQTGAQTAQSASPQAAQQSASGTGQYRAAAPPQPQTARAGPNTAPARANALAQAQAQAQANASMTSAQDVEAKIRELERNMKMAQINRNLGEGSGSGSGKK